MKKRISSLLMAIMMIISMFGTAGMAMTDDGATVELSPDFYSIEGTEAVAESIDVPEPAAPVEETHAEDAAEGDAPVESEVNNNSQENTSEDGASVEDEIIVDASDEPETVTAEAADALAAGETAVAKIGEEEYASLQAAVNVAEDGVKTTVTMLADIEGLAAADIVTVAAEKNIVLDMAGHSITVSADFAGRPIANKGTLTITGNGTIDSSASINGYGAVRNDGTLIIENGRYIGSVYGDGAAVRNGIGSHLTVYDGYFAATGAIYNVGEATIYKGEFETLACSGCGTPYAYALNNRDESGVSGTMKIVPANDDDVLVHGPQGALAAVGGAKVYVEGGTFYTHPCENNHTGSTFYALYVSGKEGMDAATCVVNGGKFSTTGANACLYLVNTNPSDNGGNPGDAVVVINGGSFDQGSAGKLINFNDKPGGVLEITSGEFIGTNLESVIPYIDPASVQVTEDGKIEAKPRTAEDTDTVAEVGGKYYASLQDAVNAAESGATVTLMAAADWSAADGNIVIEKTLVLELAGKTLSITGVGTNGIAVQNGGDLTIQNGSIEAEKVASITNPVVVVTTGSSLTLKDINSFNTDGTALYPRGDAAKVTVVDSEINAPNSYAVATNASGAENYNVVIELKNSTFTGNSPVLINVPGTLKVDGCSVTGQMHGIIVRGGTAEISNSTVIQNYPGTEAQAQSMANYFNNRNWADGNTVNLAAITIGNKGGSAYQYPSDVRIVNSTVKVEGDHSDLFPCVYVYANESEGNGVTLGMIGNTLSGGTDPQIVYGNEKANVTEKAYVAEIGGEYYETLQSAIDAAEDGATITLRKDTKENVVIAEGQNIILDLNGSTLNGGTVKGKAALENNGTVIIKDSSADASGVIMREDADGGYYTVVNKHAMEIQGGTITNNTTGSSVVVNLTRNGSVFDREGVTMTISGGKLESPNYNALKNDPGAYMKIIGEAEITNAKFAQFYGTVDIDGGHFLGAGNLMICSHRDDSGEYPANVTISGNADIDVQEIQVIHNYTMREDTTAKASLTITGGSINSANGLVTYDGYKGNLTKISNKAESEIAVSDGTFSSPVSAAHCAEGYVPTTTADENGKYTVVTKASVAVASVTSSEGTTSYYETIQDAVTAAAESTAPPANTVTLLKDTEENVVIAVGQNITLDLNGRTLNGGAAEKKAAIRNNGIITITDTSEGAKGTITRGDDNAFGYYVIDNQGTMTIAGGNITNNSNKSSMIRNAGEGEATLSITGGKLQQDSFLVVKNDDEGTLNITGGTITSETNGAVQNWAKATISGGEISGVVSTFTWSDDYAPAETNISAGAVINGQLWAYKNDASIEAKPAVNVTG